MFYLQKFFVWLMVWFGTGLDHLPAFYPSRAVKRDGFPFYWGQYGCMNGFCTWAMKLDQKWQTGIYKPFKETDER